MSLASALLTLYPRPIRERWGADLRAEIQAGGWRTVPNALAGAAGLWLHPGIWPAASPRQRRLRMTTMAVAAALACWWVCLAAAELDDRRSPLITAGMTLIAAGLLFLAPLPVARGLARTSRIALTRLAVPAALGAGVVAAVHTGAGDAPAAVRALVVACWWTALALGALQVCRIIAATGPYVIPPRPARLRLGTAVLTAGSAADAAAVLGLSLSARTDLAGTTAGLALLVLLVPLVLVLREPELRSRLRS